MSATNPPTNQYIDLEEIKGDLGHAIAHGTYFNDEARELSFERIVEKMTKWSDQQTQQVLESLVEPYFWEEAGTYDYNKIAQAVLDKLDELKKLKGGE